MTRRTKIASIEGTLSLAVEALEPRLLLAADWALGMAPDESRADLLDVDSAAANRILQALGDEPGLPEPINLQRLSALLQLNADAQNENHDSSKPDPRSVRLLSGDPPVADDDDYSVDEDTTLDFGTVWFDSDWIARRELTFDNAASSTDLTDFPVLVVLDATRIDYDLTLGDGDDLRFTDADGNLLDYEIEVWDESGTSYVWVRVPTITAGSATDSIFMYYGNPDAAEGQSPRDVWSEDYTHVQHLDESSGAAYDDSTSNNYDIDIGTNDDDFGGAVFIGQAHDFDGNDQLDGDPDPLELPLARGSVSMWVQFDDRTGQINLFDTNVERDISIWTDNSTFRVDMSYGIGVYETLSGGSIQNGWNQVSFSWDSSTGDMWLYVNGVLVDQTSNAGWNPDGLDGNNMNFGGDAPAFFGFLPDRDALDGAMDEIRFSNVVRSADWVAAQFSTINDTFINFGAEESAARVVLGNDSDNEDDVLAAVLETGPANAASFTLFADGSFEYTPSANFVGTDSFTYRASDGTGLSAPATVTITVNPVNDAPSFTLGGAQTVLEDSPAVSIANFASASAGGGADEAGQTFTYEVSVGDPTLFTDLPIIDANGTLTYTLAPNAVGTTTIDVKMIDSGGTANGGSNDAPPTSFTLSITGVNDAPTATLLGDQTVLENAGPQAVAGFATALPGGGSDELGQTFTYSVTTSQPGLFSAAPSIAPDGTLTYTFADNAFGTAIVEVVVTDSGGTSDGGQNMSATYTFNLTATQVATPPSATNMDQLLTYIEDNPLDLANIVVSDANAGDIITVTLTLADPLAGALTTLSGAGETYVAATGRWRIIGTASEVNTALASVAFIPSSDYALDTSIAVNVQDAAGTGPADGIIVLQATPINDAPSATFGGNITVAEDAGAQTFAGFATAFAGGGADEVGQTFTFVVSTDQASMFSVGPSIAPDGTLTFTAADNATGSTTVRVRVMDSGGTTDGGQNVSTDYTFTITIANTDDAPTAIYTTQTLTYLEDGGVVDFADIIVSDADAGELLTVTLTLADPGAGTLTTLSGSGETFDTVAGQWRITGTAAQVNAALASVAFAPNADYARDTSIAVSIQDAAGTGPADGLITLQAASVNDAPDAVLAGDITVAEDSGAQTIAGFASANAGGGADETGQTFSYVVAADDPNLFAVAPTIAPDGTLTFTAADNASGTTTVRVRVFDNGGTANGGQNASVEYVFNLTISGEPDAPVATNTNQTLRYIEDGAPVEFADINISDADAGEFLTVTLTLTDAQAGVLTSASGSGETFDALTGQWRIVGTASQVNAALAAVAFDPAADFAQDTSITVNVRDAAGTGPADGLITLLATPINDAPTLILAGDVSVIEDAGAQTISGFASPMAGGGGDETGQTFSYLVSTDQPELFDVAPTIAPDGTLTFSAAENAAGTTTVRVRVIDSGGTADGGQNASIEYAFNLTITSAPDAPTATQLNQLQRYVEDALAVALDDILVTDSDPDAAVTATLTLSDSSAGRLSIASGQGETYDVASGIWQITGTADQVSIALAAVVFQPAENFAGAVHIATQIADETGLGPPAGAIELQVTAVNDAPIIALAGDQTIVEDAEPRTVHGFASLIANGGADEVDQTISFDVITDNPGLFLIAPQISPEGDLSYELAPDANGTANVTVVARDDGGRGNGGQDTTAPLSFRINVSPVNDAPEASNQFVVAPPSGIVVLSAATFGFADPTDGDQFEGIFITSLPAQGELLLDGARVTAGSFVSAEDLEANRLTLSANAQPGDSLLLNFDFLVRDSGGTGDGGSDIALKPNTITVAVDLPANDNGQTTDVSEDIDSETDAAQSSTAAIVKPESSLDAELPDDAVAAVAVPQIAPLEPTFVAPPTITSVVNVVQPQTSTTGGDSSVVTPSVSRAMAALLENLRDAVPQASVVTTSASFSTPLTVAAEQLVEQLGDLRDDVVDEQSAQELVVMQSSAVAFGLSVGYVSWLLRGGVLLSSMLTSLPAWRFIDPLPIFSGARVSEEDDESLQDIVATEQPPPPQDHSEQWSEQL